MDLKPISTITNNLWLIINKQQHKNSNKLVQEMCKREIEERESYLKLQCCITMVENAFTMLEIKVLMLELTRLRVVFEFLSKDYLKIP